MFKNYFKTAIRNLAKSKLYSLINITGLSVGIASCMLIFLYVQFDLSYDKFHQKGDRIYRLTEILHLPKEDRPQAVTSPPMAPAMKDHFPEVENITRITYSGRLLSVDDRKFYDTKIMYADSTFFNVFTFPLTEGDPNKALTEPYSIVLTKSAAKRYFGNTDPLGKVMKLSDTLSIKVTGLMNDVPPNSHFRFDCILSRVTINDLNHNEPETHWFNNGQYSYILLKPGRSVAELQKKYGDYVHKEMAEERKNSGLWYDFVMQPLASIHLHSNINSEINPNSDIAYIYIFSAAAILILLIACCNFINLSTARSLNRSKEIGLRKVIGARRTQLMMQFLSESFLFALIGGLIAFALVELTLPAFNHFTGKSLPTALFQNKGLLLIFGGILLSVGLLAGAYPALMMSSFAPITALRGVIRHGWQDIILRKGLVVFQFTIAIILIIGTVLVLQQLRYLQNRKLGLKKDQIVELGLRGADLAKGNYLLSELKKGAGVVDATLTDFSFKEGISNIAVLPEGAADNEITSQAVISVDDNFFKTFQIPMVAGRSFDSHAYPTDSSEAFVINEAAVKVFGWKTANNAIGKGLDWGLGKKGRIIGVTRNFNFASLHDDVKPLVLHINPDWYRFVALQVKPQDLQSTLKKIESTWSNIATTSPFQYTFLDEDFGNLYKEEKNLKSVLGLFTLLSVFVACLGLFGLAAFTIRQRFKEIAVRKVLGASVGHLTGLLARNFLLLVSISALMAFPLAWWGVHKWLEDFAYRINIGPGVFIGAGIAALVIAFLTVSFQAIKAALSNPVKSLRTE